MERLNEDTYELHEHYWLLILFAISHQEEGTTNHEPKLKVPLAGDLLGRERVTGAKRAQMACDQPEERYENITETPALWHAKQAFLKVKLAFCIVS